MMAKGLDRFNYIVLQLLGRRGIFRFDARWRCCTTLAFDINCNFCNGLSTGTVDSAMAYALARNRRSVDASILGSEFRVEDEELLRSSLYEKATSYSHGQ